MRDADDNTGDTLARSKRLLEEMISRDRQRQVDLATRTTRLRVNKRTHRIRFEHETEDSAEVVIEPKGVQG